MATNGTTDTPLRKICNEIVVSKSRTLTPTQQKKINEYLNQPLDFKNSLHLTVAGFKIEAKDDVIEYYPGLDLSSSLLWRKSKAETD